MTTIKREIISGIDKKRIHAYFSTVAERYEAPIYLAQNWQVEVKETTTEGYGRIKLPKTILVFIGREEDCLKAVDAYRMRFLSAGG